MLAHRNAIFGEDAMAKQARTQDLKRKRAAVAAAFALLLAAGTGLGGCEQECKCAAGCRVQRRDGRVGGKRKRRVLR